MLIARPKQRKLFYAALKLRYNEIQVAGPPIVVTIVHAKGTQHLSAAKVEPLFS